MIIYFPDNSNPKTSAPFTSTVDLIVAVSSEVANLIQTKHDVGSSPFETKPFVLSKDFSQFN